MSIKSIMAGLIAILSAAFAFVVLLLSGKSKDLKREKEKNKVLEKNAEVIEGVIIHSTKARRQTNETLETLETGNSVNDFNSCISQLCNSSKRAKK